MRSGNFGVFTDEIAYPTTSNEVKDILQFAQKHDVVVIPYGGGTSVCGHITPEKGELGIKAIKGLCDMFDPDGRMNPGKLVP